jgi:hypothetical protein
LPEDITEVSDSFLMSLFRQYVVWESFFASVLAEQEGAELWAKAQIEIAEAQAKAQATGNVTERRFTAAADEKVVEARQAAARAKRSMKTLTATMESVNRASNFVSRELSRRIGREPANRRVDRYGGA